jgi:hypothetical protein
MKRNLLFTLSLLATCTGAFSQVESDKPIVLTGGTGERYITGLEAPMNGPDAVNKDYVDAAVSGSGGGPSLTTLGNGSLPTMMSDESSTGMNYIAALDYCRNLEEDSHTDWRLPSFEEVLYLRANDATFANIPVPSSTNEFWTYALPTKITGSSNGNVVRCISMNFGSSAFNTWNANSLLRARCVR